MDDLKLCPLTGARVKSSLLDGIRFVWKINSTVCGSYEITGECLDDKQEEFKKIGHILAGLILESNEEGNKPLLLKTDNIGSLLNDPRVPKADDIERKKMKILKALRKKTEYFGQPIPVQFKKDKVMAYSPNQQEFKTLISLLLDQKLLNKHSANSDYETYAPIASSTDVWILSLTDRAFSLLGQGVLSNQVFIASYFNESHGRYIEAMKKGVSEAGLEPESLWHQNGYSERIMDKALTEIAKSKFVVVDLTGNRSNVAFEAGFALALSIEMIFVCHEDWRKEKDFYSGHYNISFYKDEEELKQIVRSAIEARLSRKKPL